MKPDWREWYPFSEPVGSPESTARIIIASEGGERGEAWTLAGHIHDPPVVDAKAG